MNALRRRSIRFRLTAWYALVLALAILLFALATSAVMERRLDESFDRELLDTARAIQRTAEVRPSGRGFPALIDMPALDPFSIAGYFIQIYRPDGSTAYRSESLGLRNLPPPDLSQSQDQVSSQTVSIDGQEMRLLYAPLRLSTSDELLGVLVVATSTDQFDRAIDELRTTLIAGSLTALAIAITGGWFLAGRALRPVERMRREVAAIALDGATGAVLAERIQDPRTDDEISRLAQTFNELLARLEAAFETERRFIADASHELRTPLTAIRGNVDVLIRQARRAGEGTPEQREALDDIQREASRMSRLLEDLLTLARTSAGFTSQPEEMHPIALDIPITRAARTARTLAPDREIDVSLVDTTLVRADTDQIEQVVLILLDNALRHSAAPSPVIITLRRTGARAEIAISDQGEGIAPEHLPHLFDRFYRIDTARGRTSGGTGLGLAIADALIRRAGGAITVTSQPGEGATFTISLPAVPEAATVR